jgi:hypothetical protein
MIRLALILVALTLSGCISFETRAARRCDGVNDISDVRHGKIWRREASCDFPASHGAGGRS